MMSDGATEDLPRNVIEAVAGTPSQSEASPAELRRVAHAGFVRACESLLDLQIMAAKSHLDSAAGAVDRIGINTWSVRFIAEQLDPARDYTASHVQEIVALVANEASAAGLHELQ
jgi:hypothetical protein